MAELTIRMASNLVGYTFAEVTVPVHDDITPEEIAQRHWDVNMRFLLEQERIANEPVTEEQEAAVTKAATETLTEKLSATKVAEEQTESSEAPWEAKPEATASKPWQQKPTFTDIPNLFG